MNFSASFLATPIKFSEVMPGLLIIENPSLFTDLISRLKNQEEVPESRFFYQASLPVPSKSIELIVDPLGINLNQRTILTKLLNFLVSNSLSTDYIDATSELHSKINEYLYLLLQESEFDLSFSISPYTAELLKSSGIKFISNGSLLETILEYLKASSQLLKKSVFVFVNLSSYLTTEELRSLHKAAAYIKLHLFLIESSQRQTLEFRKDCIIIDSELCEIRF